MQRLFLLAVAASLMDAAVLTETKRKLTSDGAGRIAEAALAAVKKMATTGAIAVVDDGGNLLVLHRAEGTFPAAASIAIGKARTAAQFQRPTQAIEELAHNRHAGRCGISEILPPIGAAPSGLCATEETIGKGRTAMVALDDFTPLQGGRPLLVDGQVVGAVGVSGAASAAQDEELARIAAAVLECPPPRVTYFNSQQVSEAFGKGAVLFDAGERYMVHASRREGPGKAEIHMDDADIVHVLEGTATMVTGGTAQETTTVAAGELRGSRIEGGETRELRKGDVVIVPPGVPHWFREVSQPFLYYVVKVR